MDDPFSIIQDNYKLEIISTDKPGKKTLCLSTLDDGPEIPERLRSCTTHYDRQLIETIFRHKKLWTCDEVRRDEDPSYVEKLLYYSIACHIPEDHFDGKRILDFGCGAGASTIILKRLFPKTKITGIDMDPDLLIMARERARFYGYDDIEFMHSADPLDIPFKKSTFNHIILNAVYEHLYTRERKRLLPKLWKSLQKNGIIFINETPNRWYKTEEHTTNLDRINYLPAFLAYRYVKKHWKEYKGESWKRLLKDGIRGGSVCEIKWYFRRKGCRIKVLKPNRMGVNNRLDLFYRVYSLDRYIGNEDYLPKQKLMKRTGYVNTSALILAIQKS